MHHVIWPVVGPIIALGLLRLVAGEVIAAYRDTFR